MLRDKTTSGNEPVKKHYDTPSFIGIFVVISSITGIFILSILSIQNIGGKEDTKDILNLILPVAGTWIGTILAYYFSRENFKSAQKSVNDAMNLSSKQKLERISIEKAMMQIGDIQYLRMEEDEDGSKYNLLSDILGTDGLLSQKNRLPIFLSNGEGKCVIHKSVITDFLSNKLNILPEGDTSYKTLTLKDLLTDTNISKFLKNSFVTASREESMQDAKARMGRVKNCLDVLVTENGTKNSPVVGWVTNSTITEHLVIE